MAAIEKYLVFLCSGTAKAGNKKLSYRIATKLESMGEAHIGTLQDLSEQHALHSSLQKRMIFINDCRSGCVNVFMHGFDKTNYIFLDVSPHIGVEPFDVEGYIASEVMPQLQKQWPNSYAKQSIST